jgi:thiol-disulfide isomerase/thioredoxin
MSTKNLLGIGVTVLIVGSIIGLESIKPKKVMPTASQSLVVASTTDERAVDAAVPAAPETTPVKMQNTYLTSAQKASTYEPGKELVGISGYLNLPAGKEKITLQELVGTKVVLVDFWTYSCINCQRTLPYLNAWYEKYHDQGLEIIGVHTPEFGFEKEYDNVKAAIAKYDIKYPVVQDNDYSTWSAYGNRYWPRKYFIDIDGYIVGDHIGEGGYAETEKLIQVLLKERAFKLKLTTPISGGVVAPSIQAVSGGEISPETYFGSARNQTLANGTAGVAGGQTFVLPGMFDLHKLYLGGTWNITPEYAVSGSGAHIVFRYFAQQVFLVAQAANPVIVEVRRDGRPLSAVEAGEDIVIGADGTSTITVSQARLYKILKEASAQEHILELIPRTNGLEAFTFTFG